MGKKIVVDLEVRGKKGIREVKKLNKELDKTAVAGNSASSAAAKTGASMGGLATASGSAAGGLTAVGGAVGGAAAGFTALKTKIQATIISLKTMRVAVMATGIGALLILLGSLKAAFTSSEEGQNRFAKLMGIIGSVTGNLVDILANLGEGIINAFTNPKQALIDFKNLIVENITNRFNAIIDTLGFLGSAFKKVFSGDFKGALEDAKKAGSSYVDSLTGVKNSIDKVTEATKGFVKELKEEAKIAGQIADQRAKADKLERGLTIERAKANRDRAELLEKAANKEKFTAQERIKFLEEAGKIEEEITNKEIIAARLRLDAKQRENKLSKSTKEDLNEEANLKAKLIDLETSRLTKQKLVTSQITAAIREEQAALKAKSKEFEDEYTFVPGVGFVKTSSLKNVFEKKKQKDKEDKERQKQEDKENKEREDKKLADAELRAKREIEIEQIIADRKRQINMQYIGFAAGLSGLLQQIAGKNKAIATAGLILEKGAAIANVIIGASQSIASAKFNESKIPFFIPTPTGIPLFNPLKPASLAATAKSIAMTKIGAGLAIAGIGATAIGQGKGVSGDTSTPPKPPIPSVPTAPSTPPAFNIVGQSGTNQLASAIGGQSQQPIQAFVVSSEVSTAQELDRNIIDDASIGG